MTPKLHSKFHDRMTSMIKTRNLIPKSSTLRKNSQNAKKKRKRNLDRRL